MGKGVIYMIIKAVWGFSACGCNAEYGITEIDWQRWSENFIEYGQCDNYLHWYRDGKNVSAMDLFRNNMYTIG